MEYQPEHHPSCPRFNSFDLGDDIDSAPECHCKECSHCKGSGWVPFADPLQVLGGALAHVYYVACGLCDGIGRIMG
jgi:hypothetical protein